MPWYSLEVPIGVPGVTRSGRSDAPWTRTLFVGCWFAAIQVGFNETAIAQSVAVPTYVRDTGAVRDAEIGFLPINAAWAVADGDGDGRDDLFYFGAVFDYVDEVNPSVPVLAYRNLADGRFGLMEAAQLVSGGLRNMKLARRILSGDLNGDEKADLLFANTGDDFEPYRGEDNVLLLTDASGPLRVATTLFPVFSDYTHGAAIGDVDKDGDKDLFLANVCCGEKGPYFLINDGHGNFSFDESRMPSLFSAQSGGRPGQADPREHILSADIFDANGDGWDDLVLGLAQPPNATITAAGGVLLNDGRGSFARSVLREFPVGLFGLANTMVLDFERYDITQDGILDLFVSQADGNHAGARIQVLVGIGDGTFRDESSRVPTRFPYIPDHGSLWIERLEMIDLNGDAGLDLLVQIADHGQPKTTPYVNDGRGFFEEVPDSAIPNTPTRSSTPGMLSDLPLFPVVTNGKLYLIGPEFDCRAGDGNRCTRWRVVTSVYSRRR